MCVCVCGYACYASVCVGCMWQIWDILEKSDTTPTGDRVQKESSAELHDHNLADHCQKKSPSCCNAFPVSRSLSVYISAAVLWSFLASRCLTLRLRHIAYEEIAAVLLSQPPDGCLNLLHGELRPPAARRSFAASVTPGWKTQPSATRIRLRGVGVVVGSSLLINNSVSFLPLPASQMHSYHNRFFWVGS